MITQKQRSRIEDLVGDATRQGATVTTGGESLPGRGYFFAPTVLEGVSPDSRIMDEEIFGPVAAIVGFDGEEHGIALANDTEYGLAAYIYTENLPRVFRASSAIEVGMIGIDRGIISDVAAPFGGAKESGLGRESGSEGIEEYLETKYIASR